MDLKSKTIVLLLALMPTAIPSLAEDYFIDRKYEVHFSGNREIRVPNGQLIIFPGDGFGRGQPPIFFKPPPQLKVYILVVETDDVTVGLTKFVHIVDRRFAYGTIRVSPKIRTGLIDVLWEIEFLLDGYDHKFVSEAKIYPLSDGNLIIIRLDKGPSPIIIQRKILTSSDVPVPMLEELKRSFPERFGGDRSGG